MTLVVAVVVFAYEPTLQLHLLTVKLGMRHSQGFPLLHPKVQHWQVLQGHRVPNLVWSYYPDSCAGFKEGPRRLGDLSNIKVIVKTLKAGRFN